MLTLLGAVFGLVLGAFVALARLSRSRLLSASAWTFVWLFRSIPLIVLLLILNNLGYLYEHVRLGVPFTDIVWFDTPTTDLISLFLAAVLGLTLHHAAFSAEVIRGGILAVDQASSRRPPRSAAARPPDHSDRCRRRCARSCRPRSTT